MATDTNTLATLIGSRICHDLISPIGAVSNGIELLELSGTARSEELSLVSESVSHANARIRFFRLAFGVASPDQETGSEEVNTILKEMHVDERTQVSTFPTGSFPRREVRAVLLALLCAEQAVPYGGSITIAYAEQGWTVSATSERLNMDHALWDSLNGDCLAELQAPSHVQFLMLPSVVKEAGLSCHASVSNSEARIVLRRA